MPRNAAITARRILKVNHAGEFGAICIYGAQLAIAHRFYPDIVAPLEEMRDDEIEHCRLFRDTMPERQTRPCRVMSLWSLGGYVLGFLTALGGRNLIWVCTEAVESTVHKHLGEQLAFLRRRDVALHALIASIQEQELAHLREAEAHQSAHGAGRLLLFPLISFLTEAMICLSTWGDSTWMRQEIASSGDVLG